MGINERYGEEMSGKIPNWNMAYMVASAKHIDKLPVYTDSYYKYRVMYVDMRIVISRIILYFKYLFQDLLRFINE